MDRDSDDHDIEERLRDDELIARALREAARDAMRLHRALGVPVVDWRDGRVVLIPPEQIPADGVFPPEPDDATDNPPPKR